MYEIHEFTLFSDFKNCLTEIKHIPEVSVASVMGYERNQKDLKEKNKEL